MSAFNEIHHEGKINGYSNELFKKLIKALKDFTGTDYKDLLKIDNTETRRYGVAWENHIRHAANLWKTFSWKKAIDVIKETLPEKYAEEVIKFLPKGYKETQEMIAKVKDTSTALPTKPYKLKEWIESRGQI